VTPDSVPLVADGAIELVRSVAVWLPAAIAAAHSSPATRAATAISAGLHGARIVVMRVKSCPDRSPAV